MVAVSDFRTGNGRRLAGPAGQPARAVIAPGRSTSSRTPDEVVRLARPSTGWSRSPPRGPDDLGRSGSCAKPCTGPRRATIDGAPAIGRTSRSCGARSPPTGPSAGRRTRPGCEVARARPTPPPHWAGWPGRRSPTSRARPGSGCRTCDDETCAGIFIDHSGRRRWCSDERCGVRARVRMGPWTALAPITPWLESLRRLSSQLASNSQEHRPGGAPDGDVARMVYGDDEQVVRETLHDIDDIQKRGRLDGAVRGKDVILRLRDEPSGRWRTRPTRGGQPLDEPRDRPAMNCFCSST